MELSRFLQFVLKFKRKIIWFALTISVIVFLGGYMSLKYEVETNVLIKPLGFEAQTNVSKSLSGLVSSTQLAILTDHGNSYVKILTNRKLISEVVTRLELDKEYFNKQTYLTELIDNLKQPLRFIKYGRLPATPEFLSRAIRRINRNIKATLHIKSSIIRLTVKDKDSYRAAAIANSLVDSFLNFTKENNTRAAKAARKFIEQQLIEIRSELESNKKQLEKLKAQHGLSAFSVFSIERQKIISNLEGLEEQYEANNYQLKIAKGTLAKIKKEISKHSEFQKSTYTLGSNQTLTDLKKNIFNMKIDLQKLLIDYAPENLQIKVIKDRIAMTEKAISSEVERLLTNEEYKINPIYKSLFDQQLSLERELKTLPFLNKLILERAQKYRSRLKKLEPISTKILDVNNNISNLTVQENSFLKDLYSAKALQARGLEEVQIIDRAVAPRYATIRGQPLFLYVIISFIGGMILSSFWIILQTQLKGTIIDEKDIINEELCPPAKIISISLAKKKQRQKYKMQTFEASNLLYQFIQSSKMEDEFRYLAGRFSSGGFLNSSKPNCYCVTSSIPKEGKTTSAANLAVALARLSKKVVIVDCQKITPAINELFLIKTKIGLVKYMESPSQKMLDRMIVQSGTKGLSIISYGDSIKDNADLFYDKKFNFLLKELKQRFEHVILDCPPVLESAESLSVAIHSEVDGVILVVQANRARKADLIKTCSYIESVNARLLAVICNKI